MSSSSSSSSSSLTDKQNVELMRQMLKKRKRGDKESLKCLICSKKFSSPAKMKIHLVVHTGERNYECKHKDCGKKFKTKGNLTMHKLSVHLKDKNHECNYKDCGKKFSLPSNLKSHILVHTGEKNYECKHKDCNKKFRTKGNLTMHKRSVHLKERNHQCKLCLAEFSQKAHLDEHMRTHTGEKPFKCDFKGCNRSFAKRGNLKLHQRRAHTKEKPYKCRYCERTFASSGDRLTHEKVHLGIKNYKCDKCDKAFVSSGNLKKHKERNHGIKAPRVYRRAEKKFRDLLLDEDFTFEWDFMIRAPDEKTGSCTTGLNRNENGHVFFRVDFVLYGIPGRIVVVSIDEHQHNTESYTWDCENTRMQEIIHSLRLRNSNGIYDNRPFVWIRLNPDKFTVDGVNQNISLPKRFAAVVKGIRTITEPGFYYYCYSTENGKLYNMAKYFEDKLKENNNDENLLNHKKMVEKFKVVTIE